MRERELAKGVLVGLVVGIVQAVVWARTDQWDEHAGGRGPYSLVPAVVLTGPAMVALAGFRRWPLVALVGGIATLALGQALWRIVPDPTVYGLHRSVLGWVHLSAAVAGFAVAAWALAATRRWWSRLVALVVLIAVWALAIPLEKAVLRRHLARGIELSGLPLVAPDIPGYKLASAHVPGLRHVDEPTISLYYLPPGAEKVGWSHLGISVGMIRGSVASAARACKMTHERKLRGEPCRAASRDRWVRHTLDGDGSQRWIVVFVRRNGALLTLRSGGADETTLLAAAETIRPISAETLVELAIAAGRRL
ncbi:hypothetical protein [Rhizohabitans arisaemae]|uniref:hypothetical protein n=1 Tax=Rhizohabitans arisaemae TaxID=2720610 RepID=UPI0024B1C7EE|nr:hypothetical protein [Rhizohabitans arisaemae]